MKKASFTFLLASSLFFACNNKQQVATQNVTSTDTITITKQNNDSLSYKEVQKRVEEIYSFICKHYNAYDNNVSYNTIVQKYCSDSWKLQAAQVDSIDAKNDDEIGLWDYDYWIQAQDNDKLSFKNVRVLSLKGNTAETELTLHNFNDFTIHLTMVKEHGNWFVDDLLSSKMKSSVRATQTEYIKSAALNDK